LGKIKKESKLLNFHYCKAFLRTILNHRYKDEIIKKIEENKKRLDLKNIGNIQPLTGLYVLKIAEQQIRVIIEEKKSIDIKGNSIDVYFVRDAILEQKFENEYGRILYAKLKNREWLKSNPLSKEDIEDFKIDYLKKQENKEEKKEFPPKNLISWLDDFSTLPPIKTC